MVVPVCFDLFRPVPCLCGSNLSLEVQVYDNLCHGECGSVFRTLSECTVGRSRPQLTSHCSLLTRGYTGASELQQTNRRTRQNSSPLDPFQTCRTRLKEKSSKRNMPTKSHQRGERNVGLLESVPLKETGDGQGNHLLVVSQGSKQEVVRSYNQVGGSVWEIEGDELKDTRTLQQVADDLFVGPKSVQQCKECCALFSQNYGLNLQQELFFLNIDLDDEDIELSELIEKFIDECDESCTDLVNPSQLEVCDEVTKVNETDVFLEELEDIVESEGCNVGKDFGLLGVTRLRSRFFACHYPNDDSDSPLVSFELSPTQPSVQNPDVSQEDCESCCVQTNQLFDNLPSFFNTDACKESCADLSYCFIDQNADDRVGCAIGFELRTTGKVIIGTPLFFAEVQCVDGNSRIIDAEVGNVPLGYWLPVVIVFVGVLPITLLIIYATYLLRNHAKKKRIQHFNMDGDRALSSKNPHNFSLPRFESSVFKQAFLSATPNRRNPSATSSPLQGVGAGEMLEEDNPRSGSSSLFSSGKHLKKSAKALPKLKSSIRWGFVSRRKRPARKPISVKSVLSGSHQMASFSFSPKRGMGGGGGGGTRKVSEIRQTGNHAHTLDEVKRKTNIPDDVFEEDPGKHRRGSMESSVGGGSVEEDPMGNSASSRKRKHQSKRPSLIRDQVRKSQIKAKKQPKDKDKDQA